MSAQQSIKEREALYEGRCYQFVADFDAKNTFNVKVLSLSYV